MSGEGQEADGSAAPAGPRHFRRLALMVMALAFVGAMAVIVIAIPGGSRTGSPQPDTLHSPGAAPAAATILITINSLDANQGLLHVRLQAVGGAKLPPEGATLLTSVGAVPTITVRPDAIEPEISAEVPVTSGSVSDYPFDTYRLEVHVLAVAGTGPQAALARKNVGLTVRIVGRNDAAGVSVSARTTTGPDQVKELDVHLWRSAASRGWVLAIMAIFWAIAIGAVAVTVLVFRRERNWETRLLAWLAAMLFALISLRAAAPGSPPIGTFFDFYAVFEALSLVALSLIALTVFYVATPRRQLGL